MRYKYRATLSLSSSAQNGGNIYEECYKRSRANLMLSVKVFEHT